MPQNEAYKLSTDPGGELPGRVENRFSHEHDAVWNDLQKYLEPGETKYDITVPVVEGNRPVIGLKESATAELVGTAMYSFDDTNEHSVKLRFSIDQGGINSSSKFGLPLTADSDFGLQLGSQQSPVFEAFEYRASRGSEPQVVAIVSGGGEIPLPPEHDNPDRAESGHGYLANAMMHMLKKKLRPSKLGRYTAQGSSQIQRVLPKPELLELSV